MKLYYYVCPRCGRTWKKLLPRTKMRCSFCRETWKTSKAKGTRSRFSLMATFVWLFWIGLIWFVATDGWRIAQSKIADFNSQSIETSVNEKKVRNVESASKRGNSSVPVEHTDAVAEENNAEQSSAEESLE